MTRLQEARAALSAARQEMDAIRARADKARAALAPLQAKRAKAHARLGKTTALIVRPGNRVMVTTLDCASLSYLDEAQRNALQRAPASKRHAELVALLMSGAVKVNLAGEGTALTVKGLAAKVRTYDRAAGARLMRLRKAAEDAEAKARAARGAYHTGLMREWSDGSSVPAAELADAWASVILADAEVRSAQQASGSNAVPWDLQNRLEAAEAHLEHVQSKSKEPCPCSTCARAKREAEYKAAQTIAQREATRAIAQARKVRFLCPTCGKESTVIVPEGGRINCLQPGCNARYGVGLLVASVKAKPMPKSAVPQAHA